MNPSSSPSCSATRTRRNPTRNGSSRCDDVARPGRVALVGEQGGDGLGVGLGRGRMVGSLSVMMAMVTASTTRRCGTGGPATEPQTLGAEGTRPRGGQRRRPSWTAPRGPRSRPNLRPSRASDAARRPSVFGSSSAIHSPRIGRPGRSAARSKDHGARLRRRRRRLAASRCGELSRGAVQLDGRPADGHDAGRHVRQVGSPDQHHVRRRVRRPSRTRAVRRARWPGHCPRTPRDGSTRCRLRPRRACARAVTSRPKPRPRARSSVPIDER